jgi:hypothetical protein
MKMGPNVTEIRRKTVLRLDINTSKQSSSEIGAFMTGSELVHSNIETRLEAKASIETRRGRRQG